MAVADQKDQGTNPPADKSTFLPLKKRARAEKSLVGYNCKSDPSSESSDDGDVMCLSDEDKKVTVQELQRKAFYSVLQAFKLEASTISNKRSEIIDKLMKEWEITDETHTSLADKIQKDLVTLQQMDDSSASGEKAMQIGGKDPLTKPATPSSTFVPKSQKSWGSVNPESLIGKWVSIRLPDEAGFEEFIIKGYGAEQEMHRLMTADSDAMEVEDLLSWIDLREIPPKDIMWEGGEKPNFDAPSQFAATAQRALF